MRARVLADVPHSRPGSCSSRTGGPRRSCGSCARRGSRRGRRRSAVAVAAAGLRLAYGEWVGRARPGSLGRCSTPTRQRSTGPRTAQVGSPPLRGDPSARIAPSTMP
jgi:hypothetical protein